MSKNLHRIALVDDDPRLLESLENLLESAGYAVRSFPSALALFQAGLSDIDCLITDISMPAMDGLELVRRVKQARPDLPVFLITGRHEIGDLQRAIVNEISGFFRKPFNGPALLSGIGEALRSQTGG